MDTLKLNPARTSEGTCLPASQFPEPADLYLCDRCGRDLTNQVYRGRAHVRMPLGRPRFHCACGAQFLSGVTEWDSLHPSDRRRRIRDIYFLALIPLALALCFEGVVWLSARNHTIVRFAVSGLLLLIATPSALYLISEIPEVVGSLWRTRGVRFWRA